MLAGEPVQTEFEQLMKEFLAAKAEMEHFESLNGHQSIDYWKAREKLFVVLDKVNDFAKRSITNNRELPS